MPHIVTGNTGKRQELVNASSENYDYRGRYPNGLNLKPGEKLHDGVVDRILELVDFSSTEAKKNHPKWRKVDNVLTAYIPTDDYEKQVKEQDSRKPVSIVFPYTYSILDAALTYLMMAFIQDPIFQYEAFETGDMKGAALMQAVIAMHCKKSKFPLALHTLLRDGLAYSQGFALLGWEQRYGKKTKRSANVRMIDGQTTEGIPEKTRERALLYEGNVMYNINPYLALPDPSVSPAKVQDGNFFGWIELETMFGLLNEEAQDGSTYFNVKYLRHLMSGRSTYVSSDATTPNESNEKGDGRYSLSDSVVSNMDVIAMYVKLIPKDWGLSNYEYPETWLFRIAGDSILIQAEVVDLDHAMIPVVSTVPEDDGRSTQPTSKLETLYGLQEVGDWLFNSHMTNVRKSINNMLVVDPHLINLNDLRDPQPGKLVRLRRPQWGKGVEGAIKQLQIEDITRSNIADTAYIQQQMQLAGGTDQSMMGALRQGGPERLTGKEFQGTRGSAMSRLERLALIIGTQCMHDTGYMFAIHAQQFMEADVLARLVGDLPAQLEEEFSGPGQAVKAGFYDILIDFDLIVRDGTIPNGTFTGDWLNLYNIISANPLLMQRFDMFRIFTYIARTMGARNIHQFKAAAGAASAPQVMPDQDLLRQAQAGNVIPISAAGVGR